MIKYFIPIYGLFAMWKDPHETDSIQFVLWFIMYQGFSSYISLTILILILIL